MKDYIPPFTGLKLCVAVSGGKDSMALLCFLKEHAVQWQLTLSALHCNHAMRGVAANKDCAFVQEYCSKQNIPLLIYKAPKGALKTEEQARFWRRQCYASGSFMFTLKDGTSWNGYDAIATAHHANDNAETLLFRLARGTALAGMCGITDDELPLFLAEQKNKVFPVNALNYIDKTLNDCAFTMSPVGHKKSIPVLHPFIDWTREQIDSYIEQNHIPFVQDESNFTDAYTRNAIRHNVLPALEQAVPEATKAICRFAHLASEDEAYLLRQAKELIKTRDDFHFLVTLSKEGVLFKRAVAYIVAKKFGLKDYTAEQIEQVFCLQQAENGKRFEFLGLTALKEEKGIAITPTKRLAAKTENLPFRAFESGQENNLCKEPFILAHSSEDNTIKDFVAKTTAYPYPFKSLRFDTGKIPATAVVRFWMAGDIFTKFGGGTKSLGDYFTDQKIPPFYRGNIPLLATGNKILIVGGIEIADEIKLTDNTNPQNIRWLFCRDYRV